MRWISVFVAFLIVCFAGWSVYWVYAANQIERKVEENLAEIVSELEGQKWNVTYGDITTGGYPYRFDVRFNDITATDVRNDDFKWQIDYVDFITLAYNTNDIIVNFAPNQSLNVSSQNIIDIRTGKALASFTINDDGDGIDIQNPILDIADIEVFVDKRLLVQVGEFKTGWRLKKTPQGKADAFLNIGPMDFYNPKEQIAGDSSSASPILGGITYKLMVSGEELEDIPPSSDLVYVSTSMDTSLAKDAQDLIIIDAQIKGLIPKDADMISFHVTSTPPVAPYAFKNPEGQMNIVLPDVEAGLKILTDMGVISQSDIPQLKFGLRQWVQLPNDAPLKEVKFPFILKDGGVFLGEQYLGSIDNFIRGIN